MTGHLPCPVDTGHPENITSNLTNPYPLLTTYNPQPTTPYLLPTNSGAVVGPNDALYSDDITTWSPSKRKFIVV